MDPKPKTQTVTGSFAFGSAETGYVASWYCLNCGRPVPSKNQRMSPADWAHAVFGCVSDPVRQLETASL